MLFFLQVLLAVFLSIVVLVIVGWFLFKRWLRRKMGDFAGVHELHDPRYARPSRIQLEPTRNDDPSEAFQAQWERFKALGYRRLSDFSEQHGAFTLLRAARHLEQPIALVLTEDFESRPSFMLLALTQDNRLLAVGDGPEPAVDSASLRWTVQPGIQPAAALLQLQSMIGEHALRAPDARLVQAVYERAWAARMDASIGTPPSRAEFEQRAREKGEVKEASIDLAYSMACGQWNEQVESAVLDRFRRDSRVDAVSWERLRDNIRVVHDHLRDEDLRGLVDDETSERLVGQFLAQGLKPLNVYAQVNERLPSGQRRERLGEVMRPVRAVLYGPAQADEADLAYARTHTYEATDEAGNTVLGSVLAQNSGDAKRQLQGMGLAEARVLSEPVGNDELSQLIIDDKTAALAARSMREPVSLAMLRAIGSHAWLWLPPALLVGWSFYEGGPFGWGDYAGFVYAALALLVVAVFVLPMLLYNQYLRARLHARWRTAQTCLALLTRLNVLGAIKPHQLESEQCKLMASRGQTSQALARWKAQEAALTPEEYATGLVQIHDCAGDHKAMITAQRLALRHAASKDMPTIDLAMSLARYERAADEAEHLIAGISPASLSELALAGYHFVRGAICAERGQHNLAIRQFGEAITRARQFQSNPLILGLIAEINGHIALALRHTGEPDRANQLWQTVLPLLEVHPSMNYLLERFGRG